MFTLEPLFAIWTLGSALMLFWGVAAILPIIIHLWSRRKYREERWAAMEFLLAAMRKHSRRIRIEQLILLAIRTLILLLLGLALAEPVFSFLSSMPGALGGSRTHWVIVIDGSYSMSFGADETRLQLAKHRAQQLVAQANQGDSYTLVLMADPPRVVVGQPAYSQQDIQDEIRAVRLQHAGGDLTATVAEVQRIVDSVMQQNKSLQYYQVAIFSDLGNATWEAVGDDTCRRHLGALAKKARITLYDVGLPSVENMAITQLATTSNLVTTQSEISFDAVVHNFGTQDRSDVTLEFLVNGKRAARRTLDVRAGEQATASWTHEFLAEGEFVVSARLPKDDLPVDDRRWISVPVRTYSQVLCIQGKPGAAGHLALALNPNDSEAAAIRPQIESENKLLEIDLQQYDAVFLCNVARLGQDEAVVLKDYVRNGGGLVVCLGDQVQADSYNEQLGAGSTRGQLLPCRLGGVAGDQQYLFDALDYRHPITVPFRGFERTGLLTTPVWRYIKTDQQLQEAETALAFDTGDPAIISSRYGKGRCILVTTAVSGLSYDRNTTPPTKWTEFSTWPSFPPLVQEVLEAVVAGQDENRNRLVGEPLQSVVATSSANAPLTIAGPYAPDGGRQRLAIQATEGQSMWTFGDTWWSGVYNVELGAAVNSSQLFAVNIECKESDLARFDADLLPSQINMTGNVADNEEDLAIPTGEKQYYRYLLAAVLGLLALETVLAWRFGGTS